MMRQPAFWSRDGNRLWRAVLAPFGWIYGALTLRRLRRPGWRAPVPVVSIGNFTVGGGGKTPTTLALAAALKTRGERPFLLTRGYGGQLAGPVLVEPGLHQARDVGDEPLLLAAIAPTVVARDRRQGAEAALAAGATCLLLDDALQNPALVKDISLAVIDAAFGFGNGACLPAGPLRAPVRAMAGSVHAVLLVGDGPIPDELPPGLPLFRAQLVPAGEWTALIGRKVLAYCGLARPGKFLATLESAGITVAEMAEFPDHHAFTPAEADALLRRAEAGGLVLVTTEKDAARLTGDPALRALAAASQVVAVRLEPEPAFLDWFYRAFDSARSRASTASGPA
ncbi:MAG: tetraacyldisaccharide 4'-kinase [Rhabdaerophilum sp.]